MPRSLHEADLATARRLRRDMTTAESMLWRTLRNRGTGLKFRRQMRIGGYIADFACITERLIVELDGSPHASDEMRAHDYGRDEWLREQGWRVLRFSNEAVISGGNLVLDAIEKEVRSLSQRGRMRRDCRSRRLNRPHPSRSA